MTYRCGATHRRKGTRLAPERTRRYIQGAVHLSANGADRGSHPAA